METIKSITSGMKQSEFVSAVNNNFSYLKMNNASISSIDADGTPSIINNNFISLNSKTPFTATMASISNSQKGSSYIEAIEGNFNKIKANQTLKNVGPKMILKFDDGYVSQYDSWFPLLAGLDVNGTICPLSTHYATNHSGMTTDEDYYSWTKLNTMLDAGWDFIIHGLNYTDDYSGYTQAQIEAVFVAAIAEFTGQGLTPQFYAAHGSGNLDPKTIRLQLAARKCFSMSLLANTLVASPEDVDLFGLKNTPFDGSYNATYNIANETGVNLLKGILDSTVGTNKYCIFSGHAYSADLGTGMTTIVNYAKSLGIEIITFTEFFNGLILA